MAKNFVSEQKPPHDLKSKSEKMLNALREGTMIKECKDRVCETRPVKQIKLEINSIVIFQYTQLIQLAQWLYNQCHFKNADSKTIIRKFLKKTNEMRRWL
jgi:hypothetical protein